MDMDAPEAQNGRRPGRSEYAAFPTTHWSVIRGRMGEETGTAVMKSSLEKLGHLYWKPIYAHIRFRWNQTRQEAEDLTQDFFVWLLESPFLRRAEPGHGKFRNFVRTQLDFFMMNYLRSERSLRRGGDRQIFSLDFGGDPDQLLARASGVTPEEVLDYQWKHAILDHALERLRTGLLEDGKESIYEVFRRYDLVDSAAERPTYAQMGEDLGVSMAAIDNHLSMARKRLYRHIREIVAESVDTPEALREELELFFPRPSS